MSQTNVTRIGAVSPGTGTAVAITALNDELSPSADGSPVPPVAHSRFATAVRNTPGNMDVNVWESTSEGPTLICAKSTGAASYIAVAGLSSSTLVTTMKAGDGNLWVIPWQIVPDGSGVKLERKVDSKAGGITGVTAVVALTSSRLVTAFRSASVELALKAYDYNYATGVLTNVGNNSDSGAIMDVNIGMVRLSSTRLVTAVKNSDGNLQIIVFDVNAKGSIDRMGTVVGSKIKDRAMALNSLGGTRIATSIGDQNDASNLRIDVWDVDTNGNLHHKGFWSDSPIALVAGGNTLPDVLFPTTVQVPGGKLKTIAWEVTSGISKMGESIPSEPIGALAGATLLASPESMTFATALKQTNDALDVVTWQINPYNPNTQSPIPLDTNEATPVAIPAAKPIFLGEFSSATVAKTFHEEHGEESVVDVAMLIPWNADNLVTLEIDRPDSNGTLQPAKYRVLQVHMHRHSEHTIDDTEYKLEMHCVLGAPVPDIDGTRPAPKAVLAFLISVGGQNNAGLNFYFNNLSKPDGAVVSFPKEDLNVLLPNPWTYFSYQGSLTSPNLTDCPLNATPILFYVLSNPISVSDGQFATYEQAVAEHCRILQYGNDSKVWLINP